MRHFDGKEIFQNIDLKTAFWLVRFELIVLGVLAFDYKENLYSLAINIHK